MAPSPIVERGSFTVTLGSLSDVLAPRSVPSQSWCDRLGAALRCTDEGVASYAVTRRFPGRAALEDEVDVEPVEGVAATEWFREVREVLPSGGWPPVVSPERWERANAVGVCLWSRRAGT